MSPQKKRVDNKIQPIINRISKLDHLAAYPVKDFAEVGGDADVIAEACRRSLKPSQMRRFFDQSRRIQRDLSRDKSWTEVAPQVSMLQSLLHYARGKKVIPKEFLNVMITSLKKIDVGTNDKEKKKNFNTFLEFFQAIVAYHKFHNLRG